jgi:hypothetical protein
MNKKEVLLAGTVSISLRRVSFCVCVFLPSSVFHLLFFFFFVFAFLFYFLLFLNKKKMERRVASHLLTYGGGGERIHNDVYASLSRALSGLCCGRTPLSLSLSLLRLFSGSFVSNTFPVVRIFQKRTVRRVRRIARQNIFVYDRNGRYHLFFPIIFFFFLLKKIPN